MRTQRPGYHRVYSVFIIILLFSTFVSSAQVPDRTGKEMDAGSRRLARMMLPDTQELELIVELSDPALLDRMGGNVSTLQAQMTGRVSGRGHRIDFGGSQASTNRRQILRSKEPVQKRILELEGTRVIGSTSTLMNTIIIRTPAANYSAIRKLPGVKKIYFSRPRKALLDSAATLLNAQNLWDSIAGGQADAGKGIKIGIIDSGIDITNPMFSGTGLTPPPGFPKTDGKARNQLHTNSKVIVARSYVPDSVIDDFGDDFGHGSFVAGCAAGEPVKAPLASISGMAPGAYLGNYDVLDYSGSTTTSAIMMAIDDAVSDGMDVINLSIGSTDFLPPEENAEYQNLQKAVQAGLVVTVAAGNAGPGNYTISSPGTMPDVITVGSATNSREFLPAIHTKSPDLSTIGYVASLDGYPPQGIDYKKIVDVSTLGQDGLGCSAFPSLSLSNSIALIERGTCTFATKVRNAYMAGAAAVIVYNNKPVGMIQMGGLSPNTVATPAVMISMADGQALKEYIKADPASAQVSIDDFRTLESVPIAARIVSEFSSIGPSTDFGIKPDLVAIGENVYSATQKNYPDIMTMYDISGFTSSQGTSFAAPMVAGAAAALLSKFKDLDLTPSEIKSLLTSTASRNITAVGAAPASLLQGGSGLLNMGAAAAAGAVFSPTSLNFGVHSYSGAYSDSKNLTIKNISSSPDEFTISFESLVDGAAITFSTVNTGAVAPGSSTDITVNLGATAPATGGFQGFITVGSVSTAFVYRIPYWAGLYVPDSKRILQVTSNASGGSFSDLADAVAAAQPGNVIEIADDGTYSSGDKGVIISTNSQGLPLHGITIRAAAGKSPVIEPSAGTIGFVILGVENVRLQGLKIEGGGIGVELWQPFKTVPTSVTIDGCAISGITDSGVFVDGGGSLEIAGSTIEDTAGTGLIAGYYDIGTQITITGSTFRGNQYDALNIYDSNVYISNSTISENRGDGILLFYSTGTVAGNTIAQNRTYLRDYIGNGIEIFGGNLTVRNNLIDSNDGSGIRGTGFSAPVRIIGNTIQANGSQGLDASSFSPLIADSNLIKGNGGGIYLSNNAAALLANNLIVKSVGANGNGVTVSGSLGNVQITNNTIYKNALYGVNLIGGSASINNSIILSNSSGELQGVSADQSSMTSGDPGFVNPDSDDYSPGQNSPAIDAGSNAVADLPFVDYYGRLRVASVTEKPGNGTVDIGAIEANSAYPLVYPLIVNGDQSTLGGSFFTGVAYSNPDSTPMQLRFTAYNAEGGKLGGSIDAEDTLNSEAQKAALGFEMFGYTISTPFIGSVLGYSDTLPAGFFLLLDSGFRQFSTGANALTRLGKNLVFMRHQSDADKETRYVVFNPSVNTANITATLRQPDGTAVGDPKTAAIPAKGRTILQFDPGVAKGYVRIASDRQIAGIELVGNQTIKAALGGTTPDSQARLYFPHLVVGDHYSTQVGIVNTSTSPAELTLSAYDDSGKFIGRKDSIELAAGGQLMETFSELFGIPVDGPIHTGYLVAESDEPGIVGYTDYGYSQGNRVSDATIPADSVPSRHLLFSHIAHGVDAGNEIPYQTGIALLNPYGTDVEYKMSVYDGEGNLRAEGVYTIGPRQKVAKILTYPEEGTAFFSLPQDITFGNGHIEVTSDYGLIGLELFFTEDLSQMASVPAQIRD